MKYMMPVKEDVLVLSPLGYSHLEGRATQPLRALSQATASEQNARQRSGNSGERGRERERRKSQTQKTSEDVLTKAQHTWRHYSMTGS